MRDPYLRFKGKTYRVITWELRYDGLPESMVQETIANIKAFRKARTKERAKLREMDKQWGEVISALQHERKIVRSMMRYKTKDPAPEREEFVQHYFDVLNKLYEKLNTKRKAAQALPEHDHWTDYVPAHIKAGFVDAALEIPRRDKAKLKTPFERKLPLDLYDLKKGRLQRSTRKQLNTAIEKLNLDPTNTKLQETATAMRKALDRINNLELGEHVPNTWHALAND
jgi:hypothetical protein